jgi:hypothetical protein
MVAAGSRSFGNARWRVRVSVAVRVPRVVLAALAVTVAECNAPPPPATCDVPEHLAVDARGRPDGVYGLEGDTLPVAPLVRFPSLALGSTGVDAASGKRFLRLHAAEPDAAALVAFTAKPAGRSIAVVVGGEVACHHKIKSPVTADFQVSCCNPAACDRWLGLLKK